MQSRLGLQFQTTATVHCQRHSGISAAEIRVMSRALYVVPQGPAVCIYDIASAKTRRQAEADFDTLVSAPMGPVDTSNDPIDELALAFEAVHTRQ